WVVGIDLGTTNSVMACAATTGDAPSIDVVAVPQVIAPSEVEARELLPSFLYLADAAEVGTLDLPWARKRDVAVGAFARDRGAEVPARLVASAKSWLCHAAVGDHILLGGDNMDLALAYRMRETFAAKGAQLDAWQLRGLVHACRAAKETLLASGSPARAPITVLGRSRRVVGGALKAELARDEAERFLVDGFFPLV